MICMQMNRHRPAIIGTIPMLMAGIHFITVAMGIITAITIILIAIAVTILITISRTLTPMPTIKTYPGPA